MSYSRRPGQRSGGQRGRLPSWLVFMLAIALVFGGYYIWTGTQNFLRTGGLGIAESTQRAQVLATATANLLPTRPAGSGSTVGSVAGITPQPTATPIPDCADFRVIVPQAVIRSAPTTASESQGQLTNGEVVCVLGDQEMNDGFVWYTIDTNPATRRLNEGYMREDLIEPVNPTPTPSDTNTPAPTVTDLPTETPSPSPTRTPTSTRDPRDTDTPTPSPTPTPTLSMRSA